MAVRIILWSIAFMLPSLSLGVTLPHAVLLLIPALAAVDGLSGRGARGRLALWVGLVLFYEVCYQLPLGILAVPVGVVALGHVMVARLVRIEVLAPGQGSLSLAVRTPAIAGIWLSGMLALSGVMGGASWQTQLVVWWHQGALVPAGLLTALAAALLITTRAGGNVGAPLGYGILQSEQNLSR